MGCLRNYYLGVIGAGGGGVLRSLSDVGAVMTSLALGTAGFSKSTMSLTLQKKQADDHKEDPLVMETKLKIIEILQVHSFN